MKGVRKGIKLIKKELAKLEKGSMQYEELSYLVELLEKAQSTGVKK